MREETFRMEHVTTQDAGRTNLHDFHLHIFKGELVGLLCIDDHGKEELLELLQYGVPVKFGRIYYKEQLVNSHYHEVGKSGNVYVVGYQSHLVEELTVAENLFVMRRGMKKYFLNKRVLRLQAERTFAEFGLKVPAEEYVKNLTSFERCVTELVKATLCQSALIVVNGIADQLSLCDLEHFHQVMFGLIEKGFSILYIGNFRESIFDGCSRIAFMKNGTIVKIMDGEDYAAGKAQAIIRPVIPDLIARLDDKRTQGAGIWENRGDMEKKIAKGEWALIPENSIDKLLFYSMDYMENLCFGLEERIEGCGYQRLKKGIYREMTGELGADMDVSDIRTLSKVSLYRLIYYRILLRRPKVVLCLNPFAGCDLYLQGEVMRLMERLEKSGIAVIVPDVKE